MTPPLLPTRLKMLRVVGATVSLALAAAGTSATHAHADATGEPPPASAGLRLSDIVDSPHTHTTTARRLTSRLGDRRTGGAYLTAAGNLVVTVADPGATRMVAAHRATPKPVRFSTAQLHRVHTTLDRHARLHGAGQVQNWYVDIRSNTVTVAVDDNPHDAATQAFLATARSFGDRVDIIDSRGDTSTAHSLYGGQRVHMTNGYVCTNGFNATTVSGKPIFLTAGHCAQRRPITWRLGYLIGATHGYSFPGNDYAAFTNDYANYWTPRSAVDMHNGYARPVLGQATPPVGAEICKSGRTSGWTCGTIVAHNQTVNYGNGALVYGLVRHTACVEPGDSGGSTLSGNHAVGITSGAQFYRAGNRTVCGQRVGRPNISFYQPVGEALNAFNATLRTY